MSPTATLADTDPALNLGDADWVDELDDGDNWYTGEDPYTSLALEDGYLKLTAETSQYGWRLPWPFIYDFYLEAKLVSQNCEGDDHFGLLFRVPDIQSSNTGYLFAVNGDGQYSLLLWKRPTLEYLIYWTESDLINTVIMLQMSWALWLRIMN